MWGGGGGDPLVDERQSSLNINSTSQEPSTLILSPYIIERNNTQIKEVPCSPSLQKFVRNKNPLYRLITNIKGR